MDWNKLHKQKKFLEVGKFTSPDSNDVIKQWAKEIKHPTDVFKIIKRLKTKEVTKASIPIMSAEAIAEELTMGNACSEYSIISAAILKAAGIPTGILGVIKLDSLYDIKKYPGDDVISNHLVNIVFWENKTYFLDSGPSIFSQTLVFELMEEGFLPCKIWFTDFSEEGLTSRIDTYWSMVRAVRETLGLDYLKDALHPVTKKFLENEQ